jgi:uncharacterized protein
MGVDETLLKEIVRRVLSVARPDRIILFGSAAAGQMTKDSDLDLLVVEPVLANTHERSVQIRGALGDIRYPIDVISDADGTLRTYEACYRQNRLPGQQVRPRHL